MSTFYILACRTDGTVVQRVAVSREDGQKPQVPDHWIPVSSDLYAQAAPGTVLLVAKDGTLSIQGMTQTSNPTDSTGIVPGAPTVGGLPDEAVNITPAQSEEIQQP